MFQASNIVHEMSPQVQTVNCGGIGAMDLMVQRLGLVEAINENLKLLKVHLPHLAGQSPNPKAKPTPCSNARCSAIIPILFAHALPTLLTAQPQIQGGLREQMDSANPLLMSRFE
jgi:hypothetical protein